MFICLDGPKCLHRRVSPRSRALLDSMTKEGKGRTIPQRRDSPQTTASPRLSWGPWLRHVHSDRIVSLYSLQLLVSCLLFFGKLLKATYEAKLKLSPAERCFSMFLGEQP